jgi:putative DNA primase/helicase
MTPLDAARDYAARGWPVFPIGVGRDGRRYPLVEWRDFATTDQSLLRVWWGWWPEAWIGCPTGQVSGFNALDIDVKHPPVNGFITLADLGFDAFLPATRQVITRSGGLHLHFAVGSHRFGNTAGDEGRGIGPGLDWRAEGGLVVLPGGFSGYRWHAELGIDASLLPVPKELLPKEPQPQQRSKPVDPVSGLSPYAEAALDSACRRILAAPAGTQEATLNSECYSIGTLAGADAIPEGFARRTLLWAASQIASFDPRRPWRSAEIEQKVAHAFDDGMRHPRGGRHAR